MTEVEQRLWAEVYAAEYRRVGAERSDGGSPPGPRHAEDSARLAAERAVLALQERIKRGW